MTSHTINPTIEVNCRVQYGNNGEGHFYIALYKNGAIYQPLFDHDLLGCPIKEVVYSHVYSAQDSPVLPKFGQGRIVQCLCNHGTTLRWIGGSRVEIVPLNEMEITEFCDKFWDGLPDSIKHWKLSQERWQSYHAQESLDHWKWVKAQLLRFSIKAQVSHVIKEFITRFEEQFCPVWQDVAKKHEQPEYMRFRPGNLERNNWNGVGYIIRKFKGELCKRNHRPASISVSVFLDELEQLSGCKLNW